MLFSQRLLFAVVLSFAVVGCSKSSDSGSADTSPLKEGKFIPERELKLTPQEFESHLKNNENYSDCKTNGKYEFDAYVVPGDKWMNWDYREGNRVSPFLMITQHVVETTSLTKQSAKISQEVFYNKASASKEVYREEIVLNTENKQAEPRTKRTQLEDVRTQVRIADQICLIDESATTPLSSVESISEGTFVFPNGRTMSAIRRTKIATGDIRCTLWKTKEATVYYKEKGTEALEQIWVYGGKRHGSFKCGGSRVKVQEIAKVTDTNGKMLVLGKHITLPPR